MSMHDGQGARHGNPMMILFVGFLFLLFVLWMGSAASPGGATHTHLVACGDASLPCGSGNATAPEVPVGQPANNWYDVPGGSTDNFAAFAVTFEIFFGGILVFIAAMAGIVIWMFRGKDHV